VPRADQISGDDRLAVTRLERVGRTEHERHAQREHDEPRRELARIGQGRERAARAVDT
jgi:hypothetical protein